MLVNTKLISEAWDFCWADNLAQRAAGNDFSGNTYYLTATDIEGQVRSFLDEDAQGKPRGSTGRYWGYTTTKIRIRGDLKRFVRDWLLSNRRLTGHNFGRGHISRMRFRPVGEPLYDGEKKTIAKHNEPPRERPVHFGQWGKPECTKAKRSMYSNHRPTARTTQKAKEVTCARCKNLLVK